MSSSENLEARLGKAVRDDAEEDAVFERVARGEATDAELALVESRAKNDEAIAIRLAAARPFDDSAIDRIASKVSAPKSKPESDSNVVSIDKGKKEEKKPATPWLSRIVTIAGPLALAAAMIFVIAGPRIGGPSGPELPTYGITASGQQEMRGDHPTPASTRLTLTAPSSGSASSGYEIVLRPTTAPATKVVAFAFAMSSSDSEPNPVDAKVEVSNEGAVRLTGSAKKLAGAKEIRIVIGSPAAIGKFDDAVARAKSNKSDREVKVLSVPIDRSSLSSPSTSPSL